MKKILIAICFVFILSGCLSYRLRSDVNKLFETNCVTTFAGGRWIYMFKREELRPTDFDRKKSEYKLSGIVQHAEILIELTPNNIEGSKLDNCLNNFEEITDMTPEQFLIEYKKEIDKLTI
jgi:hypothetical protein